jgi:hypothetical protein
MDNTLSSNAVYLCFEPRSGQTKDYKRIIFCFSLRSKKKDRIRYFSPTLPIFFLLLCLYFSPTLPIFFLLYCLYFFSYSAYIFSPTLPIFCLLLCLYFFSYSSYIFLLHCLYFSPILAIFFSYSAYIFLLLCLYFSN